MPLAQLREWLKEMAPHVASTDERGCPLANAAVETTGKKRDIRAPRPLKRPRRRIGLRLVRLCDAAGPQWTGHAADELDLLLERRTCHAQSVGFKRTRRSPCQDGEAMIASHSFTVVRISYTSVRNESGASDWQRAMYSNLAVHA